MLASTKSKRDKWADELNIFPEPLPGLTDETISYNLPGRAYFQASYWPAKLRDENRRTVLEPGQQLLVVGTENITLLVAPVGG
jgi:hypothetical protein